MTKANLTLLMGGLSDAYDWEQDFEEIRQEREAPVRSAYGEKVHVASKDGRTCGDCGASIAGPEAKPWPPYAHVVVSDNDPCASWLTQRQITCEKGRQ